MLRIQRTNASNTGFKQLVALLDMELSDIDGEEHAFYHQFNTIDQLDHCLVAYLNDLPIACGAIKPFKKVTMEVKRMYTVKASRGKGLATSLLSALEDWAKELGNEYCVLETGKRKEDTVALYLKNGYELIPNYGQYEGIENDICFRKTLS